MTASVSPLLRRSLALSILASLMLLVWQVGVAPFIVLHQDARARLQEAWTVQGRLVAMANRLPAVEGQLAMVRTTVENRQDLMAADNAQLAGAQLQRLLQTIAAKSNLQVRSTQILPSGNEGGLVRIGNRLRMEGELPDLVAFLAGIEEHEIRLRVRTLSVNATIPARQPDRPRLDVQLSVEALAKEASP